MTGVALVPADRPGDDAAERAPGLWRRLKARIAPGRRLHFLALPVPPEECLAVVLRCSHAPGRIAVNGSPVGAEPLGGGRYRLPADAFRRWENVVATDDLVDAAELLPMFPSLDAARAADLPEGSAWKPEGASRECDGEARMPQGPAGPEAADGDLLIAPCRPVPQPPDRCRALAEALCGFVVPEGPRAGEVWSFYDLRDHTFRLWGWRWDSGIVLEALAAAAKRYADPGLLDAARAVGRAMLAARIDVPNCPGGFAEWVDPRYSESPELVTEWVAPFNAAFIAAGLARLAEAERAAKDVDAAKPWLDAARRALACAVERGLTPAGGLYGYYFLRADEWRYLGQINDSGILPRGLAVVSDGGSGVFADAASRVIRFVLDAAGREDGHVDRSWFRPMGAAPAGEPLFPEWKRRPDRVVPKIFLRGQAWALFGLAGAVRLTADPALVHHAGALARYVVSVQNEDGSWLYSQLQPELGSCAKSTAALALALTEYAAATGDREPLDAVRAALDRLEAMRGGGAVPGRFAALPVDDSEEGCIIYHRGRPVLCAYAGALELLARLALEELEELEQ